jgi:subtilisin family serine protease
LEPPEAVQLPYTTIGDPALPVELRTAPSQSKLTRELPGRRIPELVLFSDLDSTVLAGRLVPLPQANTLAHLNYQERRFGRLQRGPGQVAIFNPETILVKLRSQPWVSALRVETMREWDAVQTLRKRPEVQFAELDTFERRQFSPNDPLFSNQWHHEMIGSPQAWAISLGQSLVRIAIVDAPFQMDHPDLAANTVPGWDVVANAPVSSSTGIVHSTMCAGMAAAVINNAIGVDGAANCSILPISINGAISEMYDATIWAADNGVRVVNISWSGANSDTLEAAGYYLKTNSAGILVMAAIDGTGFLNWTNQPDIYCIAMTDAADNFQGTMYGPYIDFAAPGWQVFSTTTGGGYAYGTGTSYAAPLFSGVVAWLFSLNPTLEPDDVIGILKTTSVDLGAPGWDPYYGWGRINFGAAATAALGTLPRISNLQASAHSVTVSISYRPGLVYRLCRTTELSPQLWTTVTNAAISTNSGSIILTDPEPVPGHSFYRIQVSLSGS